MTDPATMPELLPCPFCGEKIVIEAFPNVIKVEHKPGNDCFLDDMEDYFNKTFGVNSINEIVKQWNTRAPSPLTEENKRLRKDVLYLVQQAMKYFEPTDESGVDSRSYPEGCIYLAKAICLLKSIAPADGGGGNDI